MFAALLDTCVLWPSLQRDFLLSLAAEGLYRPLWSEVILAELEYEESAKLVRRGTPRDLAAARAVYLVEQMRGAFDDAEVVGWAGLEGSYGLPDPNDEHVIAAAVVGGAGTIVTANVRDFPADLLPAGLEVQTPAVFAANTVALGPALAAHSVRRIAQRSGRHGPPLTTADVLDLLQVRYALDAAVDLIRIAL